jgi:hypothetical protein
MYSVFSFRLIAAALDRDSIGDVTGARELYVQAGESLKQFIPLLAKGSDGRSKLTALFMQVVERVEVMEELMKRQEEFKKQVQIQEEQERQKRLERKRKKEKEREKEKEKEKVWITTFG